MRRSGVLAVILLSFAFAGSAHAATFCVQDPSCTGAQRTTIQQAVTDAGNNAAFPGGDRIQLGPVTFIEAVTVTSGNPVDIVGAGQGRTVLSRAAGSQVVALRVDDAFSTVTDLDVVVPSGTGNLGLRLSGTTRRVTVRKEGPGEAARGVSLGAIATFSGTVNLPMTGGTQGVSGGIIEDAELTAQTGASGGVERLRRVRISALNGVLLNAGESTDTVVVDDVLVRLPPTGGGRGVSVHADSGASGSVVGRHLTLLGNAESVGVEVTALAALGADATVSVNIASTIIRGFETDLRRSASSALFTGGVAEASVGIKYSNYDPAKTSSYNEPGGIGLGAIGNGPGNRNLDPRFVNAPSGDFRLGFTSPLIEGGDPLVEDSTDLDRLPRVVDGDGDGTAVADMGAFEYQRRAPAVTASAASPTALAGQPVAFNGSASDPDGDTLGAFEWTFDDGATAVGATVIHAFAAPGPHVAMLRVVDAAGAAGAATATVSVTPAPAGPGGGSSTPARAAVGAFSVTNKVFAVGSKSTGTSAAKRKRPPKGTSFRFSLDRAARVSLLIERALAGRRGAKKKCVKPSRKLRKAKRCTRYQGVGTLTRSGTAGKNSVAFSGRIGSKALKPGTYRAVITATAPGAPKSSARTVTFKIVKG